MFVATNLENQRFFNVFGEFWNRFAKKIPTYIFFSRSRNSNSLMLKIKIYVGNFCARLAQPGWPGHTSTSLDWTPAELVVRVRQSQDHARIYYKSLWTPPLNQDRISWHMIRMSSNIRSLYPGTYQEKCWFEMVNKYLERYLGLIYYTVLYYTVLCLYIVLF